MTEKSFQPILNIRYKNNKDPFGYQIQTKFLNWNSFTVVVALQHLRKEGKQSELKFKQSMRRKFEHIKMRKNSIKT